MEDLKNLVRKVKESKTLEKLSDTLFKYRLFIIILGCIIIFQFILIYFQYSQSVTERIAYKLNYLSIYNLEQLLVKKDRKREAMYMVCQVAAKYNPNFNESDLVNVAETIYEKGERQYGIPTEEWIILFTFESAWNRKAVSSAGAKGLGQLMPITGRLYAEKLGIFWDSEVTPFIAVYNVQIAMRYYFDLKVQYGTPEYYLLGYERGPDFSYPYWRKKEPIPGKYLRYVRMYVKIKKEVEKIIGKKILIPELKEDKY